MNEVAFLIPGGDGSGRLRARGCGCGRVSGISSGSGYNGGGGRNVKTILGVTIRQILVQRGAPC